MFRKNNVNVSRAIEESSSSNETTFEVEEKKYLEFAHNTLMKLVLLLLHICGIILSKEILQLFFVTDCLLYKLLSHPAWKFYSVFFQFYYSVTILVFILIIAISSTVSFEAYGFVFQLVLACFLFLYTTMLTNLFVYRSEEMHQFFLLLVELEMHYLTSENAKFCFKAFVTIITAVLVFLVFLISIDFVLLNLNPDNVSFSLRPFLLWLPYPMNVVFMSGAFLAGVVIAASLISNVVVFSVILHLLSFFIHAFNEKLKITVDEINNGNTDSFMELEKLFVIYGKIAKATNLIDDRCGKIFVVITPVILTMFSSGVYLTLYDCGLEYDIKVLYFMYVTVEVILLSIFFHIMGNIHTAGLQCKHIIACLRTNGLPKEHLPKAYTITSFMQHDNLGVTAMGFYTYTREYELSLISTCISYVTFMMQMRPLEKAC